MGNSLYLLLSETIANLEQYDSKCLAIECCRCREEANIFVRSIMPSLYLYFSWYLFVFLEINFYYMCKNADLLI